MSDVKVEHVPASHLPAGTHKPNSFLPVRACIFDMDGLLIDSEDKVAETLNEILTRYDRPPLTSRMRCQLMGVPGSSNSDLFHDWAQLPIPREQYAQESHHLMYTKFAQCRPLPGAFALVSKLSGARGQPPHSRVELAVASTSSVASYRRKMTQPETSALMGLFPQERIILGNNPSMPQHKKKPAPDVYVIALEVLNETRPPGTRAIEPNECLAFEDSIAGVEAARRAGMRVVWVPHPISLNESDRTQQSKILAARSGMFDLGDEHQLGQIDDGWGECIQSLSEFDYEKYGIFCSDQ
ncbi:haloacid dehalogenase-like hydrolase, putative [Cordyceps militaris CM01]|uniref:Haloacid dehalogenase-like hydrolase, putative n=1 Tax=Cordyceps militaris (strain CM01) TaxID=983644 RepID=G3JS19_CORMM|nr:haloacid dehalogenase-like hydrolase, putative [Cordyceps militaris CM01]EGX88665.1 haloacid dehalogenase-like hydrolase, putative [Cordyceps militaris CM01]